jgi:hypothetical protein
MGLFGEKNVQVVGAVPKAKTESPSVLKAFAKIVDSPTADPELKKRSSRKTRGGKAKT